MLEIASCTLSSLPPQQRIVVAAHLDVVDPPPQRKARGCCGEGPVPGERVLVVRVHQRPVYVQQCCGRRHTRLVPPVFKANPEVQGPRASHRLIRTDRDPDRYRRARDRVRRDHRRTDPGAPLDHRRLRGFPGMAGQAARRDDADPEVMARASRAPRRPRPTRCATQLAEATRSGTAARHRADARALARRRTAPRTAAGADARRCGSAARAGTTATGASASTRRACPPRHGSPLRAPVRHRRGQRHLLPPAEQRDASRTGPRRPRPASCSPSRPAAT